MPVDYENDVVLLTCASGKQCSQLIPLLYGKWKQLRLAVNSSSSEERLKKQYPNATVLRADMLLAEDARRVLSGVTTVLYIGPTFHHHETQMGYTMIDAAIRESRIGSLKHFIYSSVLHPQLRKLLNHDSKRYVEEYLVESGLNYTIIQPSHLLDMLPVPSLVSQPTIGPIIYSANFNPEIKFSFTILSDLSLAFSTIISERESHYLATYTAVSTSPTSYTEVISQLSSLLSRPIQIETKDFFTKAQEFQDMLFKPKEPKGENESEVKIPTLTRDAAHRLLLYYNFHGLRGNPSVLSWLIKRPTTTIYEFLERRVKECQDSSHS